MAEHRLLHLNDANEHISAVDKQYIVDVFEDPEWDYKKMTDTLKVDDDMRQCVVRLVKQHLSYTLHQLNVEKRRELPNNSAVCDFTLHRLMENVPAEHNRGDVKQA